MFSLQSVITDKEDRLISRISKLHPFNTSADILSEVKEKSNHINISAKTIRRRLNRFQLRICIARHKPLVKKKLVAGWSLLTNTFINQFYFGNEFWYDELIFNMIGSDGKVYVRRPPN